MRMQGKKYLYVKFTMFLSLLEEDILVRHSVKKCYQAVCNSQFFRSQVAVQFQV
jgi:hypothetical protein